MTAEVEFHTGVADVVGFTGRLLRKAHRQGVAVICTAPPSVLAALDRALWFEDERGFVPHVRLDSGAGANPALCRRTPIWLSATAPADAQGRVLINAGAAALAQAAALTRLIEVVSADDQEADEGRARWRAYKAAGLQVVHHPAAAG